MEAGTIVMLNPDETARAVTLSPRKEPPLADVFEYLRALVVVREAEQRSTYSDQCVGRVLEHVEQLRATIRQLAELSAVDSLAFCLNQYEITRVAHKQLATFDPPKA